MTQTIAHFAHDIAVSGSQTDTAKPAKQSLLARIADGIRASRERRAEAEIARYIRVNGGTITDEMERRIADAMVRSA